MELPDLLLERAAQFIPVLLSLTVHEWAHAWTAWRLGDDTARMLGRVSLNPVDHIDPIGTLLLPMMGIPFGWAKPVPFNPTRMRQGVSMPMGLLLVAAAGPISNFLIAGASCGVLAAMSAWGPPVWDGPASSSMRLYFVFVELLELLVLINILLGCFNLLPIPPLDGSRIVEALVPMRLRGAWNSFASLGPILLLAVIVLPALTGYNVLAVPMEWANELLQWVWG
jgi:Zn-dependent protease